MSFMNIDSFRMRFSILLRYRYMEEQDVKNVPTPSDINPTKHISEKGKLRVSRTNQTNLRKQWYLPVEVVVCNKRIVFPTTLVE
jgi:late competence protein required for DNA uptake (superfamily II DNA/RNA helicase)